MNKLVTNNIVWFVFLVAFQGLVLRHFSEGVGGSFYFHVFLYPLFLFRFPIGGQRYIQLLVAFALGLGVDFFYDSPGINAAASVFTMYLRPLILKALEPREGYNINASPSISQYGVGWIVRYTGILLLIHLFIFFSIDAFTYYYIIDIILKTLSSFIISLVFILMTLFIFNTKQ